jgi:thiamine biosynthesis lipoprotein
VAKLLSLYLFLGLAFALFGCGESRQRAVLVLDGETMGTYYQIKVVNPPADLDEETLRQQTDTALAQVNQSMSTYIADSELMQVNAGPVDTWLDVSDSLYEVLATSEEVSRLTGGAFDITVAPLVNLWGFGPDKFADPPSEEQIAAARELVGFEYLKLSPDSAEVLKLRNVQLDLSAVAKGYGADYLAEVYTGLQLRDFMIEIGGELRLSGHNPEGKPWRIGIENPSLSRTGVVQAVELTDAGMATSGDYRNYYEVDGQRLSHIIDPTTGRPISHKLASVTIIAETAAEADALATAFTILGADKGRALAEDSDIAAYFIERQNGEFVTSYSSAFEQYLP